MVNIAELVSKFLIDDEFILQILNTVRDKCIECEKCKSFVETSDSVQEVLLMSGCVSCKKYFKLMKSKLKELVDLKEQFIGNSAEIFKSIFDTKH
jgi:hypothetical protein